MNTTKLDQLREKYLEVLNININANPDAYPWLKSGTVHGNVNNRPLLEKTPEQVTDKIMKSVVERMYTIDANSAGTLNEAVRLLGVKPTQKALNKWLSE